MKYIEEIDVKNKKVILRLDLNVTIKDGKILDDTKIRKSIPTIEYLLKNDANILIMSHLGKVTSSEDKVKNTLRPVAAILSKYLNTYVNFIPDTRSDALKESITNNHITLMENTRFEDIPDKLESACDSKLSAYWASLGDVFINDAFGTSHRKHASNYGVAKNLPSAYGFLIKEELDGLRPIINNPEKPFTVIMGGAKVDDKIALIESILTECDYLLVGGGIANTFLKAFNKNIGNSLYSKEYVEKVQSLIAAYPNKIYMPADVVVKGGSGINSVNIDEISETDCIYDIGPKTIKKYADIIQKSQTIFVNGTMGMYEEKEFACGTEELYQSLAQMKNAKVIAGGGDALASINKLGNVNNFYFLSTGGGATLEYITTKKIKCFEV